MIFTSPGPQHIQVAPSTAEAGSACQTSPRFSTSGHRQRTTRHLASVPTTPAVGISYSVLERISTPYQMIRMVRDVECIDTRSTSVPIQQRLHRWISFRLRVLESARYGTYVCWTLTRQTEQFFFRHIALRLRPLTL